MAKQFPTVFVDKNVANLVPVRSMILALNKAENNLDAVKNKTMQVMVKASIEKVFKEANMER